jgi:penicillin-binding protein 1A
MFGKQMLYGGGLRIQTTLNMPMQDAAERSFQAHIVRLRRTLSSMVDGGMMSLEVATGQVKAMVGGIDFRISQYNRATQARRQMGSIFKPLIYAVALNQGVSLCHIETDEPIEIMVGNQLWKPKNNDAQFHGPMTLAHALSHSINTVVVQLLLRSGIEHVLHLAGQCGLTDLSNHYPSLALGCIEANVIEAVGMFNIFANYGTYVQPYGISWVKDRWGSKIYKVQPVVRHVLQPSISDQIAQVLTHWFGRVQRKYPQPWIGSQALCKTGTTNDSRTCWFIGSTPTLTTGMYIGCDDNTSLGNNIYPLQTAFPLWMEYNRIIETSVQQFRFSGDLHRQVRHELTGDYIDAHAPHAIELLCP